MKIERLVFDTSVLISAALWRGKPFEAVQLAREAEAVLLFCDETLEELATRLMREKFDPWGSRTKRLQFIRDIRGVMEPIKITGRLQLCRDPKDDKVIETALVGRADCLVTGDRDLLALRPIGESSGADKLEDALYEGVAVVRPAEFLRLLAVERGRAG